MSSYTRDRMLDIWTQHRESRSIQPTPVKLLMTPRDLKFQGDRTFPSLTTRLAESAEVRVLPETFWLDVEILHTTDHFWYGGHGSPPSQVGREFQSFIKFRIIDGSYDRLGSDRGPWIRQVHPILEHLKELA